MATAIQIRLVALELKENIAAQKTATDAINTVVTAWTLDGLDAALPTGAAVKEQLAAYDALTKPTNTLADALTAIRAVA